ncbi:hypothetical protein NIES2104_46500 [Leptolyngbya sp. NIES-2104]|nr:hypothetical protein NIES2104_46500 [Leptolyngbya sp. NIES-2104]
MVVRFETNILRPCGLKFRLQLLKNRQVRSSKLECLTVRSISSTRFSTDSALPELRS